MGDLSGSKFTEEQPRPSCVLLPTRGVHVAIFTHFAKRPIATYLACYSGRLSRNPHFRNILNWNHQTKSTTYSTNVMAVIGQQNDVVLEKRSNSRKFLRKKSGQRSTIDEEAVVFFCLAAYVLQWWTTAGTLQEK